mgnify:CR=1 FL=1
MKMTLDQRVEKHTIKSSDPYYSLIKHYCHMSKNLYNHGNYLIRQAFCKEDDSRYLSYYDIEKLTKQDKEYLDYRMMPSAQSAQNTLRLLDQNWKSFFAAIKDFKKHKDKYLGRPKLPRYLKKNSEHLFFFTYQEVRLKSDNLLYFPKTLKDFTLKPKCIYKDNFNKIQQVRFLPRRNKIEIEVVYTINLPESKQDNNRYLGIDIGVDNLATCVTSDNSQDFILNGRPLKSINQYYNKKSSRLKSILKLRNDKHHSNQLDKLTDKRNNKIRDYLQKASKYIVDYCYSHEINTIVIGTNPKWKQKCNIGKKNNQTFIQIPFAKLIDQIMYKAKELGITVIKTEESYTSGTSYLDNELPTKEFYNKSRRIKRGLFKSNDGILINADQNAAYQILKKEFPITWDRGEVLSPFLVNLC